MTRKAARKASGGAQAAEASAQSTVALTVSNITNAKATLNISGHATAWYYKANKAPDNSCKGPVTAGTTTKSLTGLAANTSYTYTAYSDSACGTKVGNSVTFATKKQRLTVVEKSQVTAALSLRANLQKAHVKGDAAPYNTCTKWSDAVDDDGLLQLTGLTVNTDYTYRAYEDSGCATELGEITFTTYGAGLTLSKLGTTTATLKITGHTGVWYYQADKAPDNNTCTEVTAGTTTKDLTGLTHDTRYIYTAYSDSACTTQLSFVVFYTNVTGATPALTVSYVSPTMAQLTISGNGNNLWYFSADGYKSGGCNWGGEKGDQNIAYLTGLTPGETYTFTAYSYLNPTNCALEFVTAKPFTTPTQMAECDGLSVEAGVPADNQSSSNWVRYVKVKNNTDQAIHDVRAFTYYSVGDISTFDADRAYDTDHNAGNLSQLQPGAAGEIRYASPGSFGTPLAEVNGVVQLVNPATAAVLCETAIEPSWWRKSPGLGSGEYKRPANATYWVSTQLDNPLPGAGETATFSVTAYASTWDQLLQACVNLHFDGVAPVDADGDGHHDVVIYDGPNGKYQEDGTLNADGFRRAGRLDYDSDGYDEDVESISHRPQCSDAAGKFQGGLFRIGNTERRTTSAVKWPTATGAHAWPLTYTVKVPVTATGSGSGCLTATVRALPPERSNIATVLNPNPITAYEKAQDNTAKACLGPPPSGDPSLPVLFQEGRADLLTLHKCADGANFPCAGKSAKDPVQYVNGADGADDGSGNAAQKSGSLYRVFRTEDVVTHVADFTTTDSDDPVSYEADGGRTADGGKVVWWAGNDNANDTGVGIFPGVVSRFVAPGTGYSNYKLSICNQAAATYASTPICNSTAADTTPGSMKLLYTPSKSFVILNVDAASQPGYNSTFSDNSGPQRYTARTHFEFGDLGTYVADIVSVVTESGSTYADKATYTFHVGPAADLSVRAGGASTSVVSGKRAFTIVAESEATPEIDAEITFKHGLHSHKEQVNLQTLIPAVTVTAGTGGAAIPAANVSQFGATAGKYDTATGVWTLPEGFQGRAALTLLADASAVSSVTAAIANSAEVCEDPDGNATSTSATNRMECEFKVVNNVATSTGNHWGAYQRCFSTSAGAVGLDPDRPQINSENACTTNNSTNTWHTTEVYDWRPANNTMTFTPDARGFTLNARGAGRTSIDLRWQQRAGADDYAIYSVSTADLTDTGNLGALLSVNQLAVVPGDVTTYYHDGLRMGEKRHYLIRARKDGRPIAMSNLAGATAEIPGEPWQAPPASRAPGAVSGLTAARIAANENVIDVSWTAPSGGAPSGYDVEYQSRTGASGPWSGWTGLASLQPETAYTLVNAGGGTSFQFRVRAVNVYGGGQTNNGNWRTSTTVGPLANPELVGSLVAIRNTSDASIINVTWTAPFSGTTPTGYDVQYRSRAGNSGSWGSWNVAATGQAGMSYTLTTATVADSYQFRVRTVTVTGGDTIYGDWRTAAVVRAFDNPDQVRNLTATRNFSVETTINVAWAAPGAGTTPTGYGVEYQENGGDWVTAVANQADLTDLTYDLTTAEGGKSYRFRVRAVTKTADVIANSANAASDTVYGTWAYSGTVPRVTTPGTVGSLTATRQSDDDRKINVSWTPPSNANGATTYDIDRKEDGGAWDVQNRVTGHTAALNDEGKIPYQFGSATGNKTYQFRVRAVTRSGGSDLTGSWRSSNTVPVLSPPGQVGPITATRQNGDETKIDFQWTEPGGGAPTGYNAQYRVNGTGDWADVTGTPVLVVGTKNIKHLLTGAAGQSTYQFRVRAYTTPSSGTDLTGVWRSSNTVPRVPTPGQVGSPRATRLATDDAKIDVSWTAPGNATGATTYDVEYNENGGAWTTATTSIATITYRYGGATGAKRYLFRVRAVTRSDNQDLTGNWRSSNTVPVLPAPNQVGRVTAVRDTNDDRIIAVDWSAPTSGTTPTGYVVHHRRDSGVWDPVATTTAITTTYQFTGATGASTHQFRVRAFAVSGTDNIYGNWRASGTVPKVPTPGQVSSLTATRVTSDETKIDVSWKAPGNATGRTTYDVHHRQDGGAWATTTASTSATTTQLTNAAGGSRYQFRARAVTTLTSGTRLEGSWRSSNTVRGLPAGNIATTTATRGTSDKTVINVSWTTSNRAIKYQVQYRKNSGSWRSAATTASSTLSHVQTNAGGVEDYTFRVRGVSDAGNGAWTESATVAAPTTIGYYGAEVGVDYITLKVTSGPWWFDYRDHKGDWSSCRRVASGSHTLTNLRATVTYLFDLYSSSGCSADQFGGRQSLRTLSDVYDWENCWNVDDCRDIDSPNDMSKHTHKRSQLAQFGVTISGCDWSTRVFHSHGWPDGGQGQHWHCRQY